MNLNQRLNKIEQNLFTDEEIEDIFVARRIFRGATERQRVSAESTVGYIKTAYPKVPVSLLAAKLTGKLAAAEKEYLQRISLISDKEKASQLYVRMIENHGWTEELSLEGVILLFPGLSESDITGGASGENLS